MMDLMLKPANNQSSGREQLLVKSHSLVSYAVVKFPKRCTSIENCRDTCPLVIMGYDSYEQKVEPCALGLTCRALSRRAKLA